ncbi:MAG: hypothetical protein ACYCPN_03280 [Thermoplasmata archaeon]
MPAREPAWRLFAAELLTSSVEEQGTGERPVTYLVSPYGARIGRALLAGQIRPAERIGTDERQPFYRTRLTDPTGEIAVTAGSYQPRAMAALLRIAAPTTVLVVGRPHLYRGRDGTAFVSIRAEGIAPLDEPEYRGAVGEILAQTLDRLDVLESIRTGTGAPEAAPELWIAGARASVDRYPSATPDGLRPALRSALGVLRGEGPPPPPTPTAPPAVPAPERRSSRPVPTPPVTEAERAEEGAFLDLIDELADGSVDGYADVREAFRRLADRGLNAERAEELLGRLETEGAVEEPIVGKLRRA